MSIRSGLKKTSLILFASMFAVLLSTDADAQSKRDAYEVETFEMSGNVELAVTTSGGHIEVVGKDGNTVEVHMFVRQKGKYLSKNDTDLEDWDTKMYRTNNRVEVEAKRTKKNRGWGNNNISISYVVYVPNNTKADLKTSGGHISLSDLNGDQLAKTSGGHIEAIDVDGDINVKTSGGHITLKGVSGEVEAKTSGGHIQVEDSDSDITVSTSGGHISLENVRGNVSARTSGGNISAEFKEVKNYIELATSGGSINIEVPGDGGYDVELKGNRVNTRLRNFDGESKKNRLEGTINGGGTKISARTSGGNVSLEYN